MKKLYALAICATNQKSTQTYFNYYPAVVAAHSEDEAVGMGIRYGKIRYPENEGYSQHGAAAVGIPPNALERLNE